MSTDNTRQKVLDAAGPIFAERGYRAATIREICGAADVNLASVNYHFGDKEKLYIETVKYAHELRMQQAPLPDWPGDAPPAQRLRGFIHTMIQRMVGVAELPWQAELMMREVVQPTAACRALVEDYFRPLFELLLAILDEMVPADTPTPKRQQLALSIVGQCLFYRFHKEVIKLMISEEELAAHFAPGQLAEHIAEVSLAMLERKYSSRSAR